MAPRRRRPCRRTRNRRPAAAAPPRCRRSRTGRDRRTASRAARGPSRATAKVSRIATMTGLGSTATPYLLRSRSSACSEWASPITHSTTWPVSGFCSIRRLGSSARSRTRAVDSLSSSERDIASMATGSSAGRHRPRAQHSWLVRIGERVAGLRAGQPADRGDVTRHHACCRHVVLAERVRQGADPLVLVVVLVAGPVGEEGREVPGDVHRDVGRQGPREHPHDADPPDVRVAGRAHHLGHQRRIRVTGHRRRRWPRWA